MPRLVEANDAQKRARDALTASAWGRHLTVPQFLGREAALRAHPFARQTMRTWLWAEGPEVRCSCETFEVAAWRGGVPGRAFLVASVFTEPALRGQGFAVAMLNALCAHLTGPGVLAIALFSEVGAGLYERCGFVAQQAWDVVLPAETSKLPTDTSSPTEARPIAGPPRRATPPVLCLELSSAQCDWHVERERYYADALGRPAPAPHVLTRGTSSLALTASFQTNELHVLWYDFRDEREVAPLLTEAAAVAATCGLKLVRLWETEAFPLPPFATREVRTDELPMIRPLDGGPASWTCIERGLWA